MKKDVYAKVRDLVSMEDRVPLVGGSAASLVKEAIVDQGADIEGHGALGLDAMTQVILLLHNVGVSFSCRKTRLPGDIAEEAVAIPVQF